MATLLIGVQSEYNSCLFRDITEPSLSLLLHWNRHLHHYHKTLHAASILSSHCINCFLPCCLWGLLAANCLSPHLHVEVHWSAGLRATTHPGDTSTRDGAKVDRSADITFITISLAVQKHPENRVNVICTFARLFQFLLIAFNSIITRYT